MSLPVTIFLCVISLLIGAAIGSIVENARKKRPDAPPPLPTSDSKLAEDGDIEVFSAWRTANNQVWLNMDGKRLDSNEALSPEQRRRLLGLVVDIRPWLGGVRPNPSEPEIAAQPLQPAAPASVPALQPVKNQKNAQLPVGPEKVAPAMESILEQIDNVLQRKLADSPFKDRGIQLTEGPAGSVIINDGENRYEGVEAVPDPLIKSLIHQAVSEWEKGTK